MTSWGGLLLAAYVGLGLRRQKPGNHTFALAVGVTVAVLLAVAVTQHMV
jgi:hypothetical protein